MWRIYYFPTTVGGNRGGGGDVKWARRKAWSLLIDDEQPMINDEMRMRKILIDQFRSKKDSSPFIFKGGRGKERGWPVELLMHKNNRRRKSSWSKHKRNRFLTKEQRNKGENENENENAPGKLPMPPLPYFLNGTWKRNNGMTIIDGRKINKSILLFLWSGILVYL